VFSGDSVSLGHRVVDALGVTYAKFAVVDVPE